MPAPARITEWIRQAYPKPTVDPNWLDACLAWIAEELHLSNFDTQCDEIITNVDSQLLNSDLHDSMLAGTGFPLDIGSAENTRLRGHILVQIQGLTEIGHSAFSLKNVQQTRIDRADLAGLMADDENTDEGPIPKYPRSMLQFELSDGSQSVRAIEYRRLPELELGVTPLGYKMILKDVHVRQGIAFLEPSSVELKGYMTEELEVNRDVDFARNFRMRLGQPEPEPDSEPDKPPANNNLPGDPLPPEAPSGAVVRVARPPLREMKIDDPFPYRQPPRSPPQGLEPPTRRRMPSSASTLASTSTTTVVSPYFSNMTSSSNNFGTSSGLTTVRLSSVRRTPLPTTVVEDSFDFSDDMPMDDAFFRELDVAEQAAINTVHDHGRNIEQPSIGLSGTGATTSADSEVIVIDSDSEDKENLAPVVERRVRRRLATPGDDDSEVIVIE